MGPIPRSQLGGGWGGDANAGWGPFHVKCSYLVPCAYFYFLNVVLKGHLCGILSVSHLPHPNPGSVGPDLYLNFWYFLHLGFFALIVLIALT